MPNTHPCSELLARLDRWLARHRPRYHKGLRPGAGAAELDALQTALGRTLPAELRDLLAWHDGQSDDFIGHFESDWDLMSSARIREAKKELDADAAPGWRKEWLPFLEDDAGDYVCLDTTKASAPVREYWRGRIEEAPAAASLTTWLADFVAAVENGQYHQDPERGTFLRSGK